MRIRKPSRRAGVAAVILAALSGAAQASRMSIGPGDAECVAYVLIEDRAGWYQETETLATDYGRSKLAALTTSPTCNPSAAHATRSRPARMCARSARPSASGSARRASSASPRRPCPEAGRADGRRNSTARSLSDDQFGPVVSSARAEGAVCRRVTIQGRSMHVSVRTASPSSRRIGGAHIGGWE